MYSPNNRQFKTVKTIAIMEKTRKTDVFHKELNLVEFPDGTRKYDIRGWTDDRRKATKGVLLTETELLCIAEAGLGCIKKDTGRKTETSDVK